MNNPNQTKTLDDLSGYTYIYEHYLKNKNKKWSDWLDYSYTFKKCGKQGITGIMVSKENPYIKYCFKNSIF